jgi:hypothetical protein
MGFKASRTRIITASVMMNIQVPAYCPSVPGVHSAEKRGVLKETKKVIAISAIVMLIDESEDILDDMDEDVDVAILIAVVVADIVISDMSMMAFSVGDVFKTKHSFAQSGLI